MVILDLIGAIVIISLILLGLAKASEYFKKGKRR
jgi:hypothetical protein